MTMIDNQPRLMTLPMAGVMPIDVDDANALLVEWGHKLGPIDRPYGQEAFAFEVQGRPRAVAVSASTVSATVAGYRRQEVVELARQAAAPGWSWTNRVLLRCWREVCAPTWAYWPVRAAVSYHVNSLHRGDLYRFDGWTRVREDCGSSGGGHHSRKRDADEVIAGPKTLWLWRYDVKPEEQ